jgi:heme-degrading monooxygenase HmoA
MFVVIINFPPIKEGKDDEFREWFAWTNKEFANYEGVIARRLLKPVKGGKYAAIVEHESKENKHRERVTHLKSRSSSSTFASTILLCTATGSYRYWLSYGTRYRGQLLKKGGAQ